MGEKKTPKTYSDGDIVELFARDRQKAFKALVGQYARPLYGYIRRMLVDHDDTDDVLQNTLIKAWENMGSLKQSAALPAWLYRIATHETMDFLSERARRQHIPLDGVDLAAPEEIEQAVESDDTLGARTLAAIQSLPKVQQAVFTMKHFEGLKYREISQITGTSEGALKASYHIALEKIKAFLRKKPAND